MSADLELSKRTQITHGVLLTVSEPTGCRGLSPAGHVEPPEVPDAGPSLQGASHDTGPHPIYRMVCEGCGAVVSSELIGPDGAGEGDDGGFYCTSCRFDGDEG